MKRVAMILAVLGILSLAAGQVQAHGPYHHPSYHHGYYGYRGPAVVYPRVMVRPPVVIAPRIVVPVPIVPRAYYPPAYGYRYYAPCPRYGVYYQSRGLSLGIGF
jgi:hypothetical protein